MRIDRWLSAGGVADIFIRLMGQWLSERLGQPFIIENRPGAGGNICNRGGREGGPDGYTSALNAANAINATFYDRLNFNFIRDIAPIAGLPRSPVMVVHPSFRPRLFPSSSPTPRPIRASSIGVIRQRDPAAMCGELFKMMAGVNMIHVPYRGGGAAITDLLGGQVQVHFGTYQRRSNTLRPANCARWR